MIFDHFPQASKHTPIQNSIPGALPIIGKCSEFSGYKVNTDRSELFSLNIPVLDLLKTAQDFQIATDGFKYLGVSVTRNCLDLNKSNFVSTRLPLLDRVKKDFSHWTNLLLSFAGWVSTVKMNVLPQFLHLF